MPSLRRVPRIYHLRDTAAHVHPFSNTNATTPSELTSKSIHASTSNSIPIQPGPSRYHLRSHTPTTALKCSTSTTSSHPLLKRSLNRRVLQDLNSPMLRLPAEIIFRIGQFLEPDLSPEDWCEPGVDLLQYASICKQVRYATKGLIGRHIGITTNTTPERTFQHALARLKEMTSNEDACRRIRKLYIKDDCPLQTGPQQARMDWHRALGSALMNALPNLEMFAYARDVDEATKDSPYDTTPLGIEVIQGLAFCSRLKTLYLCGVHMICWTPERMFRPVLPQSLSTVQLLAVHDSILSLTKQCPGLKALRIWRDFLVPHRHFEDWFEVKIWSGLEELRLSGFYGNEVVQLQASLRESRRILTKFGDIILRNTVKCVISISHRQQQLADSQKAPIPLRTLDLDEPYTMADSLTLLDEFASRELRVLRLTFWRDSNFKPIFLERLAQLFPELEELQITLETPQCRWWPHKVQAWAKSLSRLSKLKHFRWNCVAFTSPDTQQLRIAMRSQAIVLANGVPGLRMVGFVDRDDYLEIVRDPDSDRLLAVRWVAKGWPPMSTMPLGGLEADLVTPQDLGLGKTDRTSRESGVGFDPFEAPPGYLPGSTRVTLTARCLSADSTNTTTATSTTHKALVEDSFELDSEIGS